MEGQSKETTIIMIIIFVVLVAALSAIGILIFNITQDANNVFGDENTSQIPSVIRTPDNDGVEVVEITATPTQNNSSATDIGSYNFNVRQSGAYNDLNPNQTLAYDFNISVFEETSAYSDVEVGVKDEGLVSDEMMRQAVAQKNTDFGDMNRIRIPSVGIDTPVYHGINGEELLNNGWWIHPASFGSTDGEKILYCHRRYFGRYDPRTCWNLDKLQDGQEIVTYNDDGERFTYRVISKSVTRADNTIYMTPSTKNYIKIITCGTETGAPGGDDYRVVVLGELVE